MSSEQVNTSNPDPDSVVATTDAGSGGTTNAGEHIFQYENLGAMSCLTLLSRYAGRTVEDIARCTSGRHLIKLYTDTTRSITIEDLKRKIYLISSSAMPPIGVPASDDDTNEASSDIQWYNLVSNTLQDKVDSQIVVDIYTDCRDAFRHVYENPAPKTWAENWAYWLWPKSKPITSPHLPPSVNAPRGFDTFLLELQENAEEKKKIEDFLISLYDKEKSSYGPLTIPGHSEYSYLR